MVTGVGRECDTGRVTAGNVLTGRAYCPVPTVYAGGNVRLVSLRICVVITLNRDLRVIGFGPPAVFRKRLINILSRDQVQLFVI